MQTLFCPHCSAAISVAPEHLGTTVACYACGGNVATPAPAAIAIDTSTRVKKRRGSKVDSIACQYCGGSMFRSSVGRSAILAMAFGLLMVFVGVFAALALGPFGWLVGGVMIVAGLLSGGKRRKGLALSIVPIDHRASLAKSRPAWREISADAKRLSPTFGRRLRSRRLRGSHAGAMASTGRWLVRMTPSQSISSGSYPEEPRV